MWIEIVTKEMKTLIPLDMVLKVEFVASGDEASLYIYGKNTEHQVQIWGKKNSVEEVYKSIKHALIEGRKEGFISVFIETPDIGEAIPV